MLDVQLIRSNPENVRRGIVNRNGRYLPVLEELQKVDADLLVLIRKTETLREKRNKIAEQIANLKKGSQDVSSALRQAGEIRKELQGRESVLREIAKKRDELLLGLPNLPHPSVPVGKEPSENKVVRQIGEPRSFDFAPKDHQTIGEALGMVDFEKAVKLSGSRFALLKGQGAALEGALIAYMVNLHVQEHGYLEIFPPYLVTAQTMTGTGQLPKFAEELYKCEGEDLYLIPTAEVYLCNLHRDETIPEEKLPIAYAAYTACFRREAGSYGKDVRGLIRQHQFNKVELVRFAKPEDSLAELEKITKHAEAILKRLELPYRVVELCTGDLGFAMMKTYDLEVWMPGEGKWREISSCSTGGDFQARRMNTKIRKKDGKKEFVHILNASGVAVGRTFAAILENYQQKDSSVAVPEVLRPYLGFK